MADQWFDQARSHNAQAISWHLAYAANARNLNDPQLMSARYKDIQKAFPENHRVQAEAAWAFYQAGLINEAKDAIDRALRLAGTNPPNAYLDRAKKIHEE